MTDTQHYKPYQFITRKDFQNLLCVSEQTAKTYFADVKKHYGIKKITFSHFKTYFKIP